MHGHGDAHHHHHGPTPERALWVAVLLNTGFLGLEAAVGFWTGSLALLSDAGHMVSDVAALLVALMATRVAKRKPSSAYTFGLRRAPVLGGLINAVSLVVVVVLIGIEAVERFRDPPQLKATAILWTAVAGLAVNLGSAWYLARSRDASVNTRGAMVHLLSDALGSVAAIVSAVAVGYFGALLADPVASVVIAVLILAGSWPLLRDTVRILLQRAPTDVNVDAVRDTLLGHRHVEAVCDFHVWGLDAGQPVLTAVLTVSGDELMEANQICDELRVALKKNFGVDHATIECRHGSSADVAGTC